MKNKICIIIPYFGEFPKWIDLFFYSCKKNSFVDFLIYTDCTFSFKDHNIEVIHVSFSDYCKQVENKIGVSFTPSEHYKLIDVKPFIGLLHEDVLSTYDFWGFGDLDLVYGDLRIILNDKNLNRYDLITTHADRVAGHFTVIRRKSKYTKYCLTFKDKLTHTRIYGLDEVDFSHMVYPQKKYLWWLYLKIGKPLGIYYIDFFKLPNLIIRKTTRKYIKELYTSPAPKDTEIWIYDIEKGIIMDPRSKKIPYLHFLFFKKTPYYSPRNYWKDDFWQVGEIDYIKEKGTIIINNKKVLYHK